MRRLNVLLKLTFCLALFYVGASAQTPAKPEENARLKPLVAEMTKAQEVLTAKTIALPEAKAVDAAKAAYDKAITALNEARKKLPEYQAALDAEGQVLRFMYQVQAQHALSSLEYKPTLNEKGELAFVKIEQPPKP